MFIVGRARFYAQPSTVTAAATQTLLPNLFDESVDTFFTPQVNLKIFPGLYTDSDTFFAPKINLVLKPSLYTDADAFFTPKVSHGLRANLYTDADTFFTPVVSQPGASTQTLLPPLYVDSDTFFTPVVRGRTTLTPSIYTDVDTFFGAVVKGRNTLTPNLFLDPDSFTTQVISQGPGGDQGLFPGVSNFFSFFFTSGIGDGGEEEEIPQGGGKQHRYHKLESSDVHSVLRCGDDVRIRYTDGKVYNYSDVSENKFKRLLKTRSPGSYVHNNIKEKHAYRRFT